MSHAKNIFKFLLIIGFLSLSACSNSIRTTLSSANGKQVSSDKVLTVEGEAAIVDGFILQARTQAIQAAINKLAQQTHKTESQNLLLGNSKVVDEWQESDRYHVQMLLVIGESEFCRASYRKRLVATAFPASVSGQIGGNETQDLYSGIPREINNLLMQQGTFIGVNRTTTVLYQDPLTAPDITSDWNNAGSVILDLARQTHAQFILSGVIRNFAVENTEYVRGSGVLSQVKSAFRDFVARRAITIDVFVHDGYSGALLFQHRYSESVLGDVWIPYGYTVGSERFRLTSAGQKITEIIDLASRDIAKLFSCYPFTARIMQVNNDEVVISAGSREKIQAGDTLVVYSADPHLQVLDINDRYKRPIGMLKVESVGADYAVGQLELPLNIRKVQAGDWVKSW